MAQPGVGAVGSAGLLADLGHEIPTALLPSFLTSTLGAPAAALGLIEGDADGLAGAARLAGGALADDRHRRRRTALGGYTATAVLSAAIGAATSAWQVGLLRTGSWIARGLRVPSRNALLADLVPPAAFGRAYGFERAMDNLGAIGGPLLRPARSRPELRQPGCQRRRGIALDARLTAGRVLLPGGLDARLARSARARTPAGR
jgi:MFS family permease